MRNQLTASGELTPDVSKRESERDALFYGYVNCGMCDNIGSKPIKREDGWSDLTVCECQAVRVNMALLDESGIRSSVEDMTFENFNAVNDWQKAAKQIALNYCSSDSGWLYLGGQVGSGKTHLGTAVLGHFIKKSSVKYMLWRDDIVRLKANVTNDSEYQEIIHPLKTVDVLYIDDFFKTELKKDELRKREVRELPTAADVKIAHELLNYRYLKKMRTIISSELFIGDVLEIDEAVGSRIRQRSKEYYIAVDYDKSKNWRLKA
jgi:DNA replication protein DnaC